MRSPLSKIPLPLALALCLCAALPAAAAATETVAPLPASDYGVRASCGPPQPGHATCQALQLVPLTAAARARTHPMVSATAARARPGALARRTGLRSAPAGPPLRLRAARRAHPARRRSRSSTRTTTRGPKPTCSVYSEEFGLPLCTAEEGCFRKVNQSRQLGASAMPFPKTTQRTHGSAEKRERIAARTRRRSDRLGSRDLARHRDRPRHLPELQDPAGRGEQHVLRRPRSRRGEGRRDGRHRDLELLRRLGRGNQPRC